MQKVPLIQTVPLIQGINELLFKADKKVVKMAAASSVVINHKKLKAIATADPLESKLTVVPPEREWECNIELGMLMLNG